MCLYLFLHMFEYTHCFLWLCHFFTPVSGHKWRQKLIANTSNNAQWKSLAYNALGVDVTLAVRKLWQKSCSNVNISSVAWYFIRHNWASHCIAAYGDSLKVFQVTTIMMLYPTVESMLTWISFQGIFYLLTFDWDEMYLNKNDKFLHWNRIWILKLSVYWIGIWFWNKIVDRTWIWKT